jgi:transposase-like protein
MSKRHTKRFKLKVVEKALNRENNDTLVSIASQYGIGYSTLTRWMYEVKQGTLSEEPQSFEKEQRPQDWTAQEKLQAIIDTEPLSEPEKGQYCRSKGLFIHQIAQWKQSFMSSSNEKTQKDKSEIRALKAENKRLQQELNRKDKALAETTALLVLKKKAQALFGSDEDN